jgi:Tol biopolymer transport system component
VTLVLAGVAASGALYMRLSDGTPVRDGAPSWSPDGRRIVFAAETGASPADIYVMNSDGSGRRVLEDSPSNDTNPRSPRRTMVTFERSRRQSGIYVMTQ